MRQAQTVRKNSYVRGHTTVVQTQTDQLSRNQPYRRSWSLEAKVVVEVESEPKFFKSTSAMTDLPFFQLAISSKKQFPRQTASTLTSCA